MLLIALGGLLAGCLRVQAALAVSARDTVAGEVVVATVPTGETDRGPALKAPGGLQDRIRVTPYDQDGYRGSRLYFSDLAFAELAALPALSDTAANKVAIELHRAGDHVVLAGHVDLTRLSPEGADVQLKISFPGPVLSTDGTDDNGTVSWRFSAGQVGQFNATVAYPDPVGPSTTTWALLLGGAVALAALLAVLLSLAAHTRRPSRARRGF